jgi:hypothetical protein
MRVQVDSDAVQIRCNFDRLTHPARRGFLRLRLLSEKRSSVLTFALGATGDDPAPTPEDVHHHFCARVDMRRFRNFLNLFRLTPQTVVCSCVVSDHPVAIVLMLVRAACMCMCVM